ncbi:MAG TPA: DUF5691 domain-containing protein [Vineibacter sp.]|nr:DUF5691 domain-containing protein [Vineibacter sp.]
MAAPEPNDAAAVEAMMARWLMGGAALEAAPGSWRTMLAGVMPAERELRLLAIAGQFAHVALRPVPPPGLKLAPPVPVLSLPTLPSALRQLFRRVLAGAKQPLGPGAVVAFLSGRGVTPHPADWLPGAGDDDLPEVYAPWVAWAVQASASDTAGGTPVGDQLTEDTWNDFPPAVRRLLFIALRRADPTQARELFAAKAINLPAEARARLVDCLAAGLDEADVPLLEGLLADRSDKVKAAAQLLLARLGHGSRGQEVAELAAFLEQGKKGLIRRSIVVRPVVLKTDAQRARRRALFEAIDFGALAAALGLDPLEFVNAWAFGVDRFTDYDLVSMAVKSAPGPIAAALAERAADGGTEQRGFVMMLAPRLEAAARPMLAGKMIRDTEISFGEALGVAGAGQHVDDASLLLGSLAGRALLTRLAGDPSDADSTPHHLRPANELVALGLLAGSAAAAAILRRVESAGLLPADPRLDMLRLNAALPMKGTP